jgi:hypothetical protein
MAVIFIEKINGPFICGLKGTPAEYKAGLDLAIAKGWLWLHESGTYVKITDAGRQCFLNRGNCASACNDRARRSSPFRCSQLLSESFELR